MVVFSGGRQAFEGDRCREGGLSVHAFHPAAPLPASPSFRPFPAISRPSGAGVSHPPPWRRSHAHLDDMTSRRSTWPPILRHYPLRRRRRLQLSPTRRVVMQVRQSTFCQHLAVPASLARCAFQQTRLSLISVNYT